MRRQLLSLVLLSILAAPGCCFASGTPGDSAAATPALSPYGPEMVRRFADYLYGSGDYLRAAGEYHRWLFLEPNAAGADSIFYLMAKALFLGGDYKGSDRLLLDLPRRYPSSLVSGSIPLYRSIVACASGDYVGSRALAEDPALPPSKLKCLTLAIVHLRLGEVAAAHSLACGIERDCTIQSRSTRDGGSPGGSAGTLGVLCESIESAGPIPRKSPLLAGALSSVLPGSGKLYCGRYADGLYALLVIGLSAWQAFEGFDEDGVDSTKGWIFGTLGAGFYLGNIYGSAVAADLYNRSAYEKFLAGIRIEIALP